MQMRGLWPVLAVGLAASTLLFTWRAGANNAMLAAPLPPNIALINLESVINNLEELQTRNTELGAYRDELVKKVEDLTKDAETLANQLKILPSGSPDFTATQLNYIRRQNEIKFEQEIAQELMARRRGDVQRELYAKVADAAKRLAQQRGFQLIVSDDSQVPLVEGPEAQVVRQVATRRIVFADPSLDISSELVAMMNNEWRAAAKPGGVQPGGQGGR